MVKMPDAESTIDPLVVLVIVVVVSIMGLFLRGGAVVSPPHMEY